MSKNFIVPKNLLFLIALFSLLVLNSFLASFPQKQLIPKKSAEASQNVPGNTEDFVADIIFGQSGFGETVPNQVVGNRVFHALGISVDRGTSPNRVYIWDSGNNRILGFSSLGTCAGGSKANQSCTNNLDCPGSNCRVNPNKNADIIIGQIDEHHATCNGDNTIRNFASASTLCSMRYPYQISLMESPEPNSLATDDNHNLYVVDKYNHRVLKFNDPFATDRVADRVWGQPNFTSRECNQGGNPTQSRLCIDNSGTNIIDATFWGAGMDVEPNGNYIWVADGANHRVLRFPENSGYPNGNGRADIVIGQSSFVSQNPQACTTGVPSDRYLCKPKAVRFNRHTGQLFVLDWPGLDFQEGLRRVMIYNPPFNNGMAASEIIYGDVRGNFEYLGNNPNSSFYHLYKPSGIEIDPFDGNAFWINDTGNSRTLYFQKGGDGKWRPTKVLGQKDLTTTGISDYSCPITSWPPYMCQIKEPGGGIGIDSAGNVYVENHQEHHILRFPAPIPTPKSDRTAHPADAILVKQQSTVFGDEGVNFISAYGIHGPNTVFLAKYPNGQTQLLADDRYRVLIWNNYQDKTIGSPADQVLFQNDFSSQENTGSLVRQIIGDSKGRIWMAKEGAGVYVFQGPISSLPQPTFIVIPQTLPIKDSSQKITLGAIVGVAYDEENDVLWVADASNYRVVRIHYPLDPSQRKVDLVLGQSNLESHYANRGQDNPQNPPCLCPDGNCPPTGSQCWRYSLECPNMFPDGFANLGQLRLDRYKNLYVIDSSHEGWQCSNNRLLEYDNADIARKLSEGKNFLNQGELVPKRVYGQSGFSGSAINRANSEKDKYIASGKPNIPFSVSFTSDNKMLMTVDGYGNPNSERIFLLSNPLPSCLSPCRIDINFSVLNPGTRPENSAYIIPISAAQPADSSWDNRGNAVIIDHTWNRILLFKTPFGPAQPTPTLSPDCPDGYLGNLNCDEMGLINNQDLNYFLSQWNPQGSAPAPNPQYANPDLINDSKIDEKDLNVILDNWRN